MSRTARPRGTQENDQVNPIRDSYVKACWGNLKMAALLNHLMFLAKCKAKNENREISNIETLEISREVLAKKVHIAPGTLVTFLQKFADAHYVVSKPYSSLFEVNTEAVEQAATNPPEKPERKAAQRREKKVSKIDNLEFPIDIMLDKFAKLETYFSNLEIGIAKLETKFASLEKKIAKLEIWKSPESAIEDAGEGEFPIPSINSNLSNQSIERENGNSAIAPLPCTRSFALMEIDLLSEDTPEAQAALSYSHDHTQTTTLQACSETSVPVQSDGYMQESKPVNEPAKPNKRTSRTRKATIEQPVLVDPSKKDVAYSEAAQQQFDWYCGCKFIHAKPPQDANKKKHFEKLVSYVHSQEEMQDLADFTKRRLKAMFNQDVYVVQPGNMANSDNLNEWIASHKQANNVIDFQEKSSERLTWKERYENDPNNGGYNDQASFDAWMKTAEEMENAAI